MCNPRSGSHLDSITKEFITFYNQESNHQGIGGDLIDPKEEVGSVLGVVKKRSRYDGSLNYYYRYVA